MDYLILNLILLTVKEAGLRQIVHHLCDSNVNSYVRFKLALTEEKPTIKVWDETEWAKLEDAKTAPIEISLDILDALHTRWVLFLTNLDEDQYKRKFIHPNSGEVSVEENIWVYSWHARHHIAQITGLLDRKGWK
jgi:hypothetical protein